MKRRGISLVETVVAITVGTTLLGIAMSLLLALVRTQERGKAHAEEQGALMQLADQFRRDVHAARSLAHEAAEKASRRPAGRPAVTPPQTVGVTIELSGSGPWTETWGWGRMMGVAQPEHPTKLAPTEKLTYPHVSSERPVAAARYTGPKWRLDLGPGHVVHYWVAGGAVVREEAVGGKRTGGDSFTLPEDYFADITVDGQEPAAAVYLILAPREASRRRNREIRIDAVLGRDNRFAKQPKGGK
jgi:type II secretory pathway pseudopilin PulG